MSRYSQPVTVLLMANIGSLLFQVLFFITARSGFALTVRISILNIIGISLILAVGEAFRRKKRKLSKQQERAGEEKRAGEEEIPPGIKINP